MRQLTPTPELRPIQRRVYRGAFHQYHYVQTYPEAPGDFSDSVKTKKEAYKQIIDRMQECLDWYKEKYKECEE